jgi:hypothetical protein
VWIDAPRAAQAAANGRDCVQQRLESRAIVVIGGREFDRQGDALPVDDYVALGPGFAPIGRVGAGERPAPFGWHAAAVQVSPAPIEFPQLAEPVEQCVVDASNRGEGLNFFV